jgi:exopolysaccharide biosynthesis protein
MKKITATIAAILLIATLIPAAHAAGDGTAVYANTQILADNLFYTKAVSYIDNTERQNSFALSLTGKGDAYPILMADDTIYGSMTIDQAVNYAASRGRNVLAAVNTDFFSMKTGVPLGLVIEDGVYKSSSEEDTAVAFMPDGGVYFSDKPQVTITLTNNGSAADMTDSGQTVTLNNFNKYRMDTGGLYLYSSAFSTVSTRTSTPGWFVKFKIVSGTPSVSGTMMLEVADLQTTDQAQPIGDGYLVLTAADAGGYSAEYAKFKLGDQVTLNTVCSDPNLAGAKWATGCGDMLIKNGALTDPAGWDKAIAAKNPRTAFGVTADGTVISYVIDGHESDNSVGLTLKDLAEEMLERGCVNAVNFDGGGSSAMSVRLPGLTDAGVVNSPSDGSSRKCAAYLLFVTDKETDGKVKYLYLQNDGPVVLAGSSVSLSYGGTDGGYLPVKAPSDVKTVSGGLGTVKGTTYKAGAVHGVDKLTLSSKTTKAKGTATIHIIYDPTDVVVAAEGAGTPLTSLTVWPGDTLQLSAQASYYGFPVAADVSAFKYSVTGDIAAVAEGGLLTAGPTAGVIGSVDLTVGGKAVSIPLTVTGFSDMAGHWAKEFVRGLYDKGIVTGSSATTYDPNAQISRADFTLMLHRAAGQPAPAGPSSFTDILPEDYYANAIAWAEENGIAKGDGSGLFNPKGTLTREQAFTLAYRAFGVLKITAADGTTDNLKDFKDKSNLSEYAVTPTATLVSMGIVSGASKKLTPAGAITRAEMAKILFMLTGYNPPA